MDVHAPPALSPSATLTLAAGCMNPVPAELHDRGFGLLVLRCFHKEQEPPAFAWIDQRIFRTPERFNRHGLFFGAAFRPEIMSWLIERVGRPSSREDDKARKNPQWPTIVWRGAERLWPDGAQTTEWRLETTFADDTAWDAFRERWRDRLSGKFDA
jgi:hypothetical protein